VWQCGRLCDGGACIEIARLGDAIVMRSFINPDGASLTVSRDEWRRFVAGIKAGVFDELQTSSRCPADLLSRAVGTDLLLA
jgi:hypothetical protein